MGKSKKINIMSLSIEPEIQEKLKEISKKRNISTSKLIRDVVDKHLLQTDSDVDTVVFRVPNDVKKNENDLRNWFLVRVESVVKALLNDN